MAVTRTGSPTEFQAGNANTGSTSITVPSDAEIALIGISGYNGANANYFTDGTVTIGGVTCTLEIPAGDSSLSFFMGTMFGLDVRSLLGSQTMAWDWESVAVADTNVRFVYAFYKGVNVSSPFTDSDGTQAAAPAFTTPTLTSPAGSLIVAWSWGFTGGSPGSPTWSNATSVSNFLTAYGGAVGSWAEGSPSGNTTVGVSSWSAVDDGGVVAVVLAPSTARWILGTH